MLVEQILLRLMEAHYITIILAACIVYFLRNKYGHGLDDLPGPFLASFTNLWRFIDVKRGRAHLTHVALFRRFKGDLVRIGPKCVTTINMDAIRQIYGTKLIYSKSAFYPVQKTLSRGTTVSALFNNVDIDDHARLRRAIAGAYTMTSVVRYEPLVDTTTEVFFQVLDAQFASKGIEFDFGKWLQFYAFDVIGEMTFSKRLGFIEQGRDVDGIIESLEEFMDYVTPVGQMPFLDKLLKKNPIRLGLSRLGYLNSTSPVVEFAMKRIAERKEESTNDKSPDFLSHFLKAHELDPDYMSPRKVMAVTMSNVFAGSDTTAITLRTILYNLLQNPSTLEKLLVEIKTVEKENGNYVSWSDTRHMPYLDAVVREGLRIHPAIGLSLERVVPCTGLTIGKHYLPPGTIVGCNAWALHRNEDIFGKETDEWRPERWLECSQEARLEMNGALFSFGMGPATCIGKNISLMEIYKFVPALLARYKIELADPSRKLEVKNSFFVKQTGLIVRLQRRDSS